MPKFYCQKNTSVNFAAGRGYTWPIGTVLELPLPDKYENKWVEDMIRDGYIRPATQAEVSATKPITPPTRPPHQETFP